MNHLEAKRQAIQERRSVLAGQRAVIDTEDSKLQAQDEVLAELLGEMTGAFTGSAAARILELPNISLADAVWETIQSFSTPFTKADLFAAIRASYPALQFNLRSIEKPLAKLLKSGKVIPVRKGTSNSPSVYEKAPLLAIAERKTA